MVITHECSLHFSDITFKKTNNNKRCSRSPVGNKNYFSNVIKHTKHEDMVRTQNKTKYRKFPVPSDLSIFPI